MGGREGGQVFGVQEEKREHSGGENEAGEVFQEEEEE